MDQLSLIIGLLLATVVAVGIGDRLRLPFRVHMPRRLITVLQSGGLLWVPPCYRSASSRAFAST